MPEWLDYGAFGLLAIVLVLLGAIGRDWIGKYLERQNLESGAEIERKAQQDEAEIERKAQQDEFFRAMMDRDHQDRQRWLEEWQTLVREGVTANQAVAEALGGLCDKSDRHEQRADERHRALMAALGD